MPTNNTFFPIVANLVTFDQLPEEFQQIQGSVTNFLAKVHYREFYRSQGPNGASARYQLILIAREDLKKEVPGTDGLALLLNPAPDAAGLSEVPLSLSYRMDILRYFKRFSIRQYAAEPTIIFDLLLDITKVPLADLLWATVEQLFSGLNNLQAFVDDFNTNRSPSPPIQLNSGANSDLLLDLAFQISDRGFDIGQVVYEYFVAGASTVEEKIDRIKGLFSNWLGNFNIATLPELMKPKIHVEVGPATLGVEFPRKYLIPLKIDGTPIPEGGELPDYPIDKTQLIFSIGNFSYQLESGLLFEEVLSGTFPLSQIGKSGLILKIENFKLDLSRTTNILEATADGRPVDFIGVYVQDASIGLPDKWFKEKDGNTLGLFARNLLIGTGGISGAISLEAINENSNEDAEMSFTLGKKTDDDTPRKGFQIGFREFYLKFQQNAIIESSIKGSLTIPKFKQCGVEGELRLNIEAFFEQDGDFRIVADPGAEGPEDELVICFREIFKIKIKNLEVGKDDNRVYLQLSGALSFENNEKLSALIKEDFEVKKFRIYSDGSFELEEGAIPLPDSFELSVGPVNLTISAIHFGAHTQHGREYKYFGFDGGIGIDPGGVAVQGEGCKCYFTVDELDPFDHFLEIEGIGINLIIPANATPATATLLLDGYLALREHEYAGSVKFELPKAQIAGGASMIYRPKDPSFLVDVSLDLATPLPLASTGLGFYGFRALFGLRYLASKESVGASNWYEYYKAPVLGVNKDKFINPEDNEDAQNPISIGAGTVLATLSDNGKAFSSRLFLLLSIPNLILLEGKANVNGERLGLIDADDPPFYAMISYSPGDSVEVGFGANYKMPREGDNAGWIATLNAEVQAGYFFQDASAWFVHIGTKDKPVTARLLDTFNGYSYLMLSARGIDAGAGVDFEFKRAYLKDTVKAHVQVYMDVWGKVAFPKREPGNNEKTQFGGGIALGGHVEANVLGVGFYIGLDTSLSAEAPRPFRVYGSVRLCVGVKIWKKKIEKCFTVEFIWERDQSLNTDAIYALPASTREKDPPPAAAVHMLSGKTYRVQYVGTDLGLLNLIHQPAIPCDSYLDIQFEKALLPGLIADKIGGFTNVATGHEDLVPPVSSARKVKHRYEIRAIDLEIYTGTPGDYPNGNWEPYHPHQAVVPADLRDEVANFKAGYWQKTGREYNKIRLLAQTPFSYTQLGQPEWYLPEQWGLTPSTLFCSGTRRDFTCMDWEKTRYEPDRLHAFDEVSIMATGSYAYSSPGSVLLIHPGELQFFFQQPTAQVKLQLLYSSAYQVSIHFYSAILDPDTGEVTGYTLVTTIIKTQPDIQGEIIYDWDTHQQRIARVDVIPLKCDEEKISELRVAINEASNDPNGVNQQLLESLWAQLIVEESRCCLQTRSDGEIVYLQHYLEQLQEQLVGCQQQQLVLEQDMRIKCGKIKGRVRDTTPPTTDAPIISPRFNSRDMVACQQAQVAAAANLHQCQELEEQINFVSFLIRQEGMVWWSNCQTQIGSICWMREEDFAFNQPIPDQEAIKADYMHMVEAINQEYVPVWRPDSAYRVRMVVGDTVNGQVKQDRIAYFGFRTGGPIGFYEAALEEENNNGESVYSDAVDAPEFRLKYYIDFDKSFPNANGRILYAKPLYYRDPELLLFFKPRHTHHFFQKWPSYVGMPELNYQLDIQIKDPLEGLGDSAAPGGLIIDETTLPLAEYLESEYDQLDPLSTEMQLMQNLSEYSIVVNGTNQNCLGEQQAIQPPQKYLTITATRLMPSKLYAAVVRNMKDNDPSQAAELHRYNFQTSRYGSFKEHIQSCLMQDRDGNERKAIFGLSLPLTGEQLENTLQIMQGNEISVPENGPDLNALYPDPFDRILLGLWKIPPMNPPICTEINYIRIPRRKGSYALLIRSPEPFNDPKIPSEILQQTVRVTHNGQEDTSFQKLFSRDGTQVLLMRGGDWFVFTQGNQIEFRYLLWNGWGYVDNQPPVII